MTFVEYDQDGNIVIGMQQDSKAQLRTIAGFQWNIFDDSENSLSEELPVTDSTEYKATYQPQVSVSDSTKEIQANILSTINPLPEIRKQLYSSGKDLHNAKNGLFAQCKQLYRNLHSKATQPIVVFSRNKERKHYNRLTLFISDSFRFGATFSIIFGCLFFSLNYQSFWALAQDQLQPIATAQRQAQLGKQIGSVLSADIAHQVQATNFTGNPLNHLPAVGPPNNRLIIPKLGLNVPITTPDFTALLQEDWAQLEKDIQAALELGVVHYPGTAEPGQAGNFFVTGHSSYYAWAPGNFKSVFAKLHHLEVGDEYFVYYGGDKHRYQITEKKEVKPDNVDVLDQPLNRRLSTLMTCTPVGTTLRRLILVAQEIDPITGAIVEVGEHQQDVIQQAKPVMLPI